MIEKKTNISNKLKLISTVFNISEILATKIEKASIPHYYKINKIAYSLFHSRENLIHVGISKSVVFKKDDLLEPTKFVSNYVKNLSTFNILELATGRGANADYIISNNLDINYTGIDISDAQISFAQKITNKYSNYRLIKQDFHNLSNFKVNSFDLVFVIESLCYSSNKQKVLNEVYRILKPNGCFIVIDGYLKGDLMNYSKDQQTAFKLTEIGMAIKNTDTYLNFKKYSIKEKFTIELEKDVSENVIPSMERLAHYSRGFFKYKILSKIIKTIFPKELLYNTITALLWTDLIKEKVACYYITVLRKRS